MATVQSLADGWTNAAGAAQASMTPSSDSRLILLDPSDNCLIAATRLIAGTEIRIDGALVRLAKDVDLGHKLARRDIAAGEKIRRCGALIGTCTVPAARGAHLHLHNLRSDYIPTYTLSDGEAFIGKTVRAKGSPPLEPSERETR
jgi:altronate dehydratase small subunit